jgi:methylglyoxal synthase
VGAWGGDQQAGTAVRGKTGKVLIIRLVKVEAIRRHEYDIRLLLFE